METAKTVKPKRYEAKQWAGILGRKRNWIVFDNHRGGIAINGSSRTRGNTFSQFASEEAAQRRADKLNADTTKGQPHGE